MPALRPKEGNQGQMEKVINSHSAVKSLSEAADAIIRNGVTNREGFAEALRIQFELQDKINFLGEQCQRMALLSSKLGQLCTRYVDERENALDVPLREVKAGISQGSVAFGGATYTLTESLGSPKRPDGSAMTEEFLKTLPKEWLKGKVGFDWSSLKKTGVTDEQLRKHGLARPLNRLWSRSVTTEVKALQ